MTRYMLNFLRMLAKATIGLLSFGMCAPGATPGAFHFQRDWKEATASWYQAGTITASGESFDPDGLTVAHKTLPFNTVLIFRRNGAEVRARVNDRGPFIKGREFDLSRGVARRLGVGGVEQITYTVVGTE